MTTFITSVSVAQVATTINTSITIVQWTLPLFLISLLVHFMPKINTALAWSSISKTLHSSLWPIILRTETSSTGSGTPVLIISFLATTTALLVILAGAITPLGLSTGPVLLSEYRQFPAQYVPDDSAIALATTPRRERFAYGRQCGLRSGSLACPGNDSPTIPSISPSHIRIFNSTPHGPFAMQYRQFFNDERNRNLSEAILGTAEVLLLRNDTFVTEGLVVDMSEVHPGIGFLNQTMPIMGSGGTWSQDILWLEPATACVNTNLTADYFLRDPGLELGLHFPIRKFNITDHGGFSNLDTNLTPPVAGQQVDLYQYAYSAAVSSNLIAMQGLNITSPAPLGHAYQINETNGGTLLTISVGKITDIGLQYFVTHGGPLPQDTQSLCQGFDTSTANITTVHISCGTMFGPPIRTDGGDSKVFSSGSKWSQELYSCASSTRASIQTVTFSASKPLDLQGLQVSRSLSGCNVLWAVEKTDLEINEVDLLWGRVDDQYENSSSLWTLRSDHLYLPATRVYSFGNPAGGSPQSAHAVVWSKWIYNPLRLVADTISGRLADYTGQDDYAMKNKFQVLVQNGRSDIGASQIINLIWTDIMANNLIGTQTDTTLLAAQNLRSIDYDFRFAVFGMTLLVIWVPLFLGALFLLVSRTDSFKDVKSMLNHLSAGRVVVGSSALHVYERPTNNSRGSATNDSFLDDTIVNVDRDMGQHVRKRDGEDAVDKSRILLELGPL